MHSMSLDTKVCSVPASPFSLLEQSSLGFVCKTCRMKGSADRLAKGNLWRDWKSLPQWSTELLTMCIVSLNVVKATFERSIDQHLSCLTQVMAAPGWEHCQGNTAPERKALATQYTTTDQRAFSCREGLQKP